MAERVFLKLGGSLVTDKRQREAPRPDVIARLAQEIRAALSARPDLELILGHGSGSFGHFAAETYQVHRGHLQDWWGYAATGAAAQRLNRILTDALLAAGVPAVSLQPSASARCRAGRLVSLATAPVGELLKQGLVPLLYGDVALDEVQGCAIVSTEQLFGYLADSLPPQRILLAGEVDGVFTADPQRDPRAERIPEITLESYPLVERMLTTAYGVDVTGGMLDKVRLQLELIRRQPALVAQILGGLEAGALQQALVDPGWRGGTRLHA